MELTRQDRPAPESQPQAPDREPLSRKREGDSDITKLGRGAVVSLIGKVGGQGLGVLTSVLVGRLLGPEGLGLYAIGWTLVRMVGLISPLGLDKGVIYYGAEYRDRDPPSFTGTIRWSIGIAVATGACIGIVLYLAAPWLATGVFHDTRVVPILRGFAPIFVAYAGLRVAAAATTISHRVQYAMVSQELSQPALNLVLLLVFHWLGRGVLGAAEATVISFAIAFVIALLFLRALFPTVFLPRTRSISSTKELMAFSVPTAFAGIFGMYIVWVNRLVVGRFLPLDDTGIYQAASQTALLPPIILAAFTVIFQPMIADLYKQGERARLNRVYKVTTKWSLYVSMPVFLAIMFYPRQILSLLFGSPYGSGAAVLVVLSLPQVINLATGAVGPLLVMTGHQKRWSLISGITFGGSVILAWLLVPRIGMMGAAVATLAAFAAAFVWGLLEVRHRLSIWPYDWRYLKGGLAVLATAVALFALRAAFTSLTPAAWLELAAGVAVTATVFLGTLLLLGLDEEDREIVGLFRKRIAAYTGRFGKP